MSKKAVTILLIILCVFFSCDKKKQNPVSGDTQENENRTEETITKEPEVKLINEDRWINTADGLNIRNQPDVSGALLVTVPAYAKVLLLEETGEELTLQDQMGKWSKIEWEGQTGWVFGGYLSSEEVQAPQPENGILGKYYFIDDPMQYIEFLDNGTCIIKENRCEGYLEYNFFYVIEDDIIYVGHNTESPSEDYSVKINIISHEELEMAEGAGPISCYMLSDPTMLHRRKNK